MKYWEKLKDPRWQKLRLKVMERDGWKCMACDNTDKTLQVHHLKYSDSGNPWDSKTEDLVCVCGNCHDVISRYDLTTDEVKILQKNVLADKFLHAYVKIKREKQKYKGDHNDGIILKTLLAVINSDGLYR